jgi:hypothetical protein
MNRGDGNWAEISPDGLYRYALHRQWGDGPTLGWLMLNPSTAGAVINDQTIGQVMFFSEREGYGAAWVSNLFAYRTFSPRVLRLAVDAGHATGLVTDIWIRSMLASVPVVVLAWGAHGGEPWAKDRRDAVLQLAAEYGAAVSCLGKTAKGEPRHPCRLGRATKLEALS